MSEHTIEIIGSDPRLNEVARAALKGAPSKELEELVVNNAVSIERGHLADADRVAKQLVKRLVAAGRIPPGALDRS